MSILKIRKTVTHIKSGKEYNIISSCLIKINGVWEHGMIYEGIDKNTGKLTKFVRTVEDFDNNFE